MASAKAVPGTESPSAGRSCSSQLFASFAAQFDVTGKTVAEINAWLAAASPVGFKRIVGTVTINAPLVIKSDTYLDATGAAITSTHVGHLLRNERHASATQRDARITIVGGTWQRNAGGQVGGDANRSHSIFLRHVDHLVVQDLKIGSTGGKYAVALGDVTQSYVGRVTAETVASDTVHITGPALAGVFGRIRTLAPSPAATTWSP